MIRCSFHPLWGGDKTHSTKRFAGLDDSEGVLKAVKCVAEHVNRDAKLTVSSALPGATDAWGLDGASLIP